MQVLTMRELKALRMLDEQKERFLTPEGLEIYSPKFLEILDNITDEAHRGCHMVYSQFRTLEGIGIFKLVLEANGFAEFKLKKEGGNWVLDIKEEDKGKPTFALYTGTESDEEKEIVRNVFNGDWKFIPPTLEAQIKLISGNNLYGEVIKVFMITASGAEGISLRILDMFILWNHTGILFVFNKLLDVLVVFVVIKKICLKS